MRQDHLEVEVLREALEVLEQEAATEDILLEIPRDLALQEALERVQEGLQVLALDHLTDLQGQVQDHLARDHQVLDLLDQGLQALGHLAQDLVQEETDKNIRY